MKGILEFIVKNLVEDKEAVSIEESEEEGVLKLKLSVAEDEMGRIIGKGGKVVKAIRSVLKIYSMKKSQRVYLELVEAQKP